MARKNDETLEHRHKLAEIKSLGLKAEAKREEGERYIRALVDPVYANSVRTRELGPAHVENQMKLRNMVTSVRDSLRALEDHLALIKRKVQDEKMGRTAMKAPSLDSIQRSIRNISAGIGVKIFDLDELHTSFDMLARHSRGDRSITPSASIPRYESGLGAFNVSSMSSSLSLDSRTKQPHQAVTGALESKRSSARLAAAWTAAHKKPIFNRSAAKEKKVDEQKAKSYEIGDLQMSFAKGPVSLGKRASPAPPTPAAAAPPPPPSPFPSAFGAFPISNQAPATSGTSSGFSFSSPTTSKSFGTAPDFKAASPSTHTFALPPSTSVFNPGGRDAESTSPASVRSAHSKNRSRPTAVPLPPSNNSPITSSSFSFGAPPFGGNKTSSPATPSLFGPPPPINQAAGTRFTSFAGLQAPTPIKSSASPTSSANGLPSQKRFDKAVASDTPEGDAEYSGSDGDFDGEFEGEEDDQEGLR